MGQRPIFLNLYFKSNFNKGHSKKNVMLTKLDIYVFIDEIEVNTGPYMKINKIFIFQNLDLIQHKPCIMFINNQVINIYMLK